MTPAEQTPAKAAWTRCPKCKQRLFNDKIDIEVHRGLCPADLARALRLLTTRVEGLATRVEGLEEPVETTPEAVEPGLDLEQVAPWPDDDEPVEADEEEVELPVVSLPSVVPSVIPSWTYGDDDDDEDEEPAPVARPVMR